MAHRRRTWHQGVINLQPFSGLSYKSVATAGSCCRTLPVLTEAWRQEVVSSVWSHCDNANGLKINIKWVDRNIKKHSWAETAQISLYTMARCDEFCPLSCSSSVAAGAPVSFPSDRLQTFLLLNLFVDAGMLTAVVSLLNCEFWG